MPDPRRGPYRIWTTPELRQLLIRRETGERTADLATEIGVTPHCLNQAWRVHLGTGSGAIRASERSTARRDIQIWALHQEGLTFREIATRLGEFWEGRRTFNRLRTACHRYAKRLKLVNPSGRADRRLGNSNSNLSPLGTHHK